MEPAGFALRGASDNSWTEINTKDFPICPSSQRKPKVGDAIAGGTLQAWHYHSPKYPMEQE